MTKGHSIGGSKADYVSVVETADDGYIVGGYFQSTEIVLDSTHKLQNHNTAGTTSDGFVIKYDSDGKVLWHKTIGGTANDQVTTIAETLDGSYIVGGYYSNEDIVLEGEQSLKNVGRKDGFVIKYDNNGNLMGQQSIGGERNEEVK